MGRRAEINKVDAVNLMVHVFNSLIMLIDLTVVGHPIQLNHAYFTMGIGLAYSIFTAVYFLAGGTTRYTECILNSKKARIEVMFNVQLREGATGLCTQIIRENLQSGCANWGLATAYMNTPHLYGYITSH